MKRIEFRAMGSRMLALVDSESPAAEPALAGLPGLFEEWEQSLSRFRIDSELSRLNRSAGANVHVSATLWQVFQAARWVETFTAGLVRPTVLDALAEAGYDRSFDLLNPHEGTRDSSRNSPIRELKLSAAIGCDESTRSLILPNAVRLDFGGVAKGWAALNAVQRLTQYGPALMDAGGDIVVSGPDAAGRAWPIGIRDPFKSATYFDTLRVERGGVATSGTDYHRWLKGGVWSHHLIDPETGLPAVTDVLAATVIAADVIRAEAAAKAVVIMGSRSGLGWLEADPSLAGVLILQSGEVIYSQRMPGYLWRES